MLYHIAQRELIDAVAKQGFLGTAHHAVVVELIDPAFTQTKRRSGEPEQTQVRVYPGQMIKDLLVLALFVVANAVAFIDNQQRKLGLEMVKITGDRLNTAKHDFAVALFALKPGGVNIGIEAKGTIFSMVLRDQLFDMRQHKHAATREPCQLGNDEAFSGTGGQHYHCRFAVTTKVGEGGVDGFLLVGTKGKSHNSMISINSHIVCHESFSLSAGRSPLYWFLLLLLFSGSVPDLRHYYRLKKPHAT
ncbi:hypothetical protein HMPREF0880_04439 [Yokenella regensburgei ATCC 43003]|nr:hypothetical protein HMPREF0880_04439 [Yokenella regensburgei ATCC 43003]